MKKAYAFMACAFLCGQVLAQEQQNKIDPDQRVKVAMLQRDLASMQARALSLQAQLQEMQVTFGVKAKDLQGTISEIEKRGDCKLDLESLDCISNIKENQDKVK